MKGQPLDKTGNERALHFLKVLVERYIRDGQPVGSRTLAKDSGLDLSPATIRNVMADLEELGLVASPHTSAGRVPTVSGYRLFVDSLLSLRPLDRTAIDRIRDELREGEADSKALVDSASQLLSRISHLAGVVMVPKHEGLTFRQIEFLPLSGRRVLTILVTSEGDVHNRVIETARAYAAGELEQAANYLNQHFAGMDIEQMRGQLLAELDETRRDMDLTMARAIEMANQVLSRESRADGDYVVSGQTNLMDFNEFAQIERLRQLLDAFTEKQEILHLLDRCTQAEGVQIFIGEESGYQPLDQCSIITAPYEAGDRVVGVLGVIGPTRMRYDKLIPLVDITAQLLGAALKRV